MAGSTPLGRSTTRFAWDAHPGRTGTVERSTSTAVPEPPAWCAARPSSLCGMWAATSTGVPAASNGQRLSTEAEPSDLFFPVIAPSIRWETTSSEAGLRRWHASLATTHRPILPEPVISERNSA